MSGFGSPVYVGESETQKSNASSAVPGEPIVSDAEQNIIDENDPRLVSEDVEMNLDGDAYAQPAPPPDRKWRAKLKLEGFTDEKGNTRDYKATQTKSDTPTPYFETKISVTLLDPTGKYDGLKLFTEYGGTVGTLQQRDGSSKVSTIIARLKQPNGEPWVKKGSARMKQKEWIDLFVKAVAGEPEIGVETEWQSNCQACSDEAKAKRLKGDKTARYPATLHGMHRFPVEKNQDKRRAGQTNDPEVACQVNPGHGFSRARAVVVGFLALNELPTSK